MRFCTPLYLTAPLPPIVAALLDGVNVASLALMAGVAWQLGRAAIADWFTILLAHAREHKQSDAA